MSTRYYVVFTWKRRVAMSLECFSVVLSLFLFLEISISVHSPADIAQYDDNLVNASREEEMKQSSIIFQARQY